MILAVSATAFCLLAIALHLISLAFAAARCRAGASPLPPIGETSPVSLVRPLCGIDNFARETLLSTFRLDYPRYEILFCLARADDPVAPLVRALIAAHPEVPARMLIGNESRGPNPKLNNCLKGWDAAAHQWIILADSNVLMPRDYIQRLRREWRPDTGLVCSMPVGSHPGNFWAELECAFLNTFQARWQYAAAGLGFGFAQGKSMLFRRDIVERGGGTRALGAEMAEDAATTKLIRAAGLKVRLVDNPFEQPLGLRRPRDLWTRQLRWARLRRMTFPAFFVPELFVGCVFPGIAAAVAASLYGVNPAVVILPLLALWFGAEAVVARRAGWHLSWRMLPAFLLRDLMLPPLWIAAWAGNSFVWRGTAMGPGLTTSDPVAKAG